MKTFNLKYNQRTRTLSKSISIFVKQISGLTINTYVMLEKHSLGVELVVKGRAVLPLFLLVFLCECEFRFLLLGGANSPTRFFSSSFCLSFTPEDAEIL